MKIFFKAHKISYVSNARQRPAVTSGPFRLFLYTYFSNQVLAIPSTLSTTPVMYDASSEARNTNALAISSG